ncbi:hypothetical protein [Bacillus testis]|uniref:hypothetical protein n=1 Tax=Bacillus testis TaxID=1622072 RepID=UPI00067F06F2|nr:hypothetical protein [Bacillus testis]
MSDYQQFLKEKKQIDHLLSQGFSIRYITENLSGAFLEFHRAVEDGSAEMKSLHITTADARKYFSVKYMEQQARIS